MAGASGAEFIALSAVMAGVKDIRAAVARRAPGCGCDGRPTVLFLDEVHRFNKAQQDTLPAVRRGRHARVHRRDHRESLVRGHRRTPLARARLRAASSLDGRAISRSLLERALTDARARAGREQPDDRTRGAGAAWRRPADGDARRALNMLELAVGSRGRCGRPRTITLAQAREVAAGGRRRFDKGGEQFYDQISALHKAVRGSDPDAALYWLCAHARRRLRSALYRAPRAAHGERGHRPGRPARAQMALEAWRGLRAPRQPRRGARASPKRWSTSPCAAKSNAVYIGMGEAMADVERYGTLEVPLHLRNAPTRS